MSRGPLRPAVDVDAWSHRLLHALLVLGYALVVCGLVLFAATWPTRPIDSPAEVPWWAPVVGLVAVGLTWRPVDARLRASAHHLVYGHRDNSYEVTERVRRDLGADAAPDEVLPTLAATLAETLALPHVAVAVDGATAAVHGHPPRHAALTTIPLRYRDVEVGRLTVSARRPHDVLSAADLRLLDDLARQVGITLHAARLSNALQASREQLVTAREEERRRIRRDLHDGLGPTLAALQLQLGAVQRTMRSAPEEADRLVAELRDDVRAATADIRRLVYDLRPPLLDEFGLVGALQDLGTPDGGLRPTVDVADGLPPLPAAVEVAVYRIAAEALHNTVRHAGATRSAVRLEPGEGAIVLTVSDDGRGLPEDYLAGVGHLSMQERAAELGGRVVIDGPASGGARVTAVLPLGALR